MNACDFSNLRKNSNFRHKLTWHIITDIDVLWKKSHAFSQFITFSSHLHLPYAQWLSKIFVLYDSIKTQHIPSIVYDIILFQQMNLLFAVASTFKMLQFATRQTFVALFVYKQHQLKWDLYKCRFANLLIFLQKFCFIAQIFPTFCFFWFSGF